MRRDPIVFDMEYEVFHVPSVVLDFSWLQRFVGATQLRAVMASSQRDRHKVAVAIEMAKENYERHGAGCCLHVVLDDGNLGRSHVEFCLRQPDCCAECIRLGRLLLRLTPLERVMVFRVNHRAECCSDEDVLPED